MSSSDTDEADSIQNGSSEREEEEENTPEEEKDEASMDDVDEEEESPKKVQKEVDPRFKENLCSMKESVLSIACSIPLHIDANEKTEVEVMPLDELGFERFATRYRKALQKLGRENVARQLREDPEGLKAFRKHCEQEDEEREAAIANGVLVDDEDEEMNEESDDVNNLANKEPPPPPYWLPFLLANDTVYFERVLVAMYGWLVPPPSVRGSNGKGFSSSFSRGSEGRASEKGEEEETDADGEIHVAPVKQRPSYFQESNAFREAHEKDEEDDEEEEEGEKGEQVLDSVDKPSAVDEGQGVVQIIPIAKESVTSERGRSKSTSAAPLCSIPNFPHSKYIFYICFDRNKEQWQLLTMHPRLYTFRVKQRLAAKQEQDGVNQAEQVEDEEDEEDNDKEAEANVNGEDLDLEVPDFDYDNVLKLNTLLLCAICNPTALRYCLLQKDQDSNVLQYLQNWLERDFLSSFPYLTTIYTTLLAIRSKDAPRISYEIPLFNLDFNFFFHSRYVNCGTSSVETHGGAKGSPSEDAAPVLIGSNAVRGKGGTFMGDSLFNLKQVDEIVSPSTKRAQNNMQALFAAGIIPTTPPRLEFLVCNDAIRLSLWLLIVSPSEKLLEWGKQFKTYTALLKEAKTTTFGVTGANGVMYQDEEGEDEEEDENEESLTESVLIEKIEAEAEKDLRIKERSMLVSPTLLPAPLLYTTANEIRRRLVRESSGKAPSKHTLAMCLEEFARESFFEDSGQRDPLVTKTFYLLASSVDVLDGNNGGKNSTPNNKDTSTRLGLMNSMNRDSTLHKGDDNRQHLRHQKLYQSDLVLLLLAALSTPRAVAIAQPLLRNESIKEINGVDKASRASLTEALPTPSENVCVVKKRASTNINHSASTVIDAHSQCFKELLQMKMQKHVTPLDKVRSGMLRLLLLNITRFPLISTAITLFEAIPLYEVLGLNESCPLPDLIDGWSSDLVTLRSTSSSLNISASNNLVAFVDYFWDEIYSRREEKLYDTASMQLMYKKASSLFDKVRERHGVFVSVLELLSRSALTSTTQIEAQSQKVEENVAPSSDKKNSVLARGSTDKRASTITARSNLNTRVRTLSILAPPEDGGNGETRVPYDAVKGLEKEFNGFVTKGRITLTNPSPYSDEYKQQESRVQTIFDALPMASKSIYTPKTLHRLLFESSNVDVITIKHVLCQPTVRCSVCADPLKDPNVPALQRAIELADFPIALLLVGLGVPLDELTDEGTTTLRHVAEDTFTSDEMKTLLEVYNYNKSAMATDPGLGFGAYKFSVNHVGSQGKKH